MMMMLKKMKKLKNAPHTVNTGSAFFGVVKFSTHHSVDTVSAFFGYLILLKIFTQHNPTPTDNADNIRIRTHYV